jgi:hypothetical protein
VGGPSTGNVFSFVFLEVPCQAEYLLGIMRSGRLLMVCKVGFCR